MFEGLAQKMLDMPRHYVWLMAAYFFFLIIDMLYFFLPAWGFGLYPDPVLTAFTLYSFVPLAIFSLELAGKIGGEHYGFVRNINYLLVIFFLLTSTIVILPVIAV